MDDSRHPQASRVVLAAWVVVGAWCALALLIVQIILGQFPALRGIWILEAPAFLASLSSLVILAVVYAWFALTLRCQSCGKRFFVEFSGAMHPDSRRIWGMDHWASAVVDVLRRGECTCMSCGALVRVR
jgi:hypothetical protein